MADGQISFSVVDGEPYVKVGADALRPFNCKISIPVIIGRASSNSTSYSEYTFNCEKYTTLSIDQYQRASNGGYLKVNGDSTTIMNTTSNFLQTKTSFFLCPF